MSYKEKLKDTLLITVIYFVMFGLLAPMEIYSGNAVDFEFGFHDFFWIFLGIYLVIWILLSVVLAFLPEKVLTVINGALTILGIEIYCQNMFFNKALIRADGGRMDWDRLHSYFVINGLEWVGIAILGAIILYFLKEKRKKIQIGIIGFLSVIQLIAVISLIITVPKDRDYKSECRIDATDMFTYAKGENIIILVLDRYASDQFQENIDKHPDMKNVLKDFTFYDNANGFYEKTEYGLCEMLAGQMPGGTTTTWREDKWSEPSVQNFYDILHDNGYNCFISSGDNVAIFGKMEALEGKFDNVKSLQATYDWKLLFRLFTKMSIYKYSPYVIKPKFEVLSSSFTDVIAAERYAEPVYGNAVFYERMNESSFVVDDNITNEFKVIHIQGMHISYDIDENAILIPEEEGSSERSRDGLNVIVTEFLNKLKEAGIYDNATIIITADHGDLAGEFGLQPTVLIKEKNSSHDRMRINSAPICLYDFVPTILNIIGEDYKGFASGTTIYDWREGDRRERSVTIDDKTYTYYYDEDELNINAAEFFEQFR